MEGNTRNARKVKLVISFLPRQPTEELGRKMVEVMQPVYTKEMATMELHMRGDFLLKSGYSLDLRIIRNRYKFTETTTPHITPTNTFT